MTPSFDTIHEKIANAIEGPIRCPLCGGENWTLYENVAEVVTREPGRFRAYSDSIGAVGGFCDRCHFIRWHAISSQTFAALG
jgi:hypothetical protein